MKLSQSIDIGLNIGAAIAMCLCVLVMIVPMRKALTGARFDESSRRTLTIDGTDRKEGRGQLAIVEFSDFECAYCAKYATEVHPRLRSEYIDTNRVVYVFRHFPLVGHSHAVRAAEAAQCAARQGRFWHMHDRLFAQAGALTETDIHRHALALRLDEAQFVSCMASDQGAIVRADQTLGRQLGVTVTPTFFLGVVESDGNTVRLVSRVQGAQSFEVFKAALDKLTLQTAAARGNSSGGVGQRAQ